MSSLNSNNLESYWFDKYLYVSKYNIILCTVALIKKLDFNYETNWIFLSLYSILDY